MGWIKRMKDLAVEAVKDEITAGSFPESKPPVAPLGSFREGRAVLQAWDFSDDDARNGAWGSSVTHGTTYTSINVGVRAWLAPDSFGPMATLRVATTAQLARILEPGIDVPAEIVDGAVRSVDMRSLQAELADELDAAGKKFVDQVTLREAIEEGVAGATTAARAVSDAVRRSRDEFVESRRVADGELSDQEFTSWVRAQVMLATGKVPDQYREQALRSVGIDAASYPLLDERCRAAIAVDPERAAYYERAVGLR